MTNEWISVKDRLPTENGDYLVAYRDDILPPYVIIRQFWNGKFAPMEYFEKETNRRATHWMPLPEPLEELQNPVITSKTMGDTCTALREKLSDTVKTEQEVVRYYSYTPIGAIQKFMMKRIKDGWKVKVCLERQAEVLVVYERTVGDA